MMFSKISQKHFFRPTHTRGNEFNVFAMHSNTILHYFMAREKCFFKSKQIETSRMRYLRQSYAPALNISSEFESFRSLFLFIAINLTSKYLFEFSI